MNRITIHFFIICGDYRAYITLFLTQIYTITEEVLIYVTLKHITNCCKWLEIDTSLTFSENLTLIYQDILDVGKAQSWSKTDVLISDSLSTRLIESHFLPGYRTDFISITPVAKCNDFKRGKGLWWFNTSLLADKTFLGTINKVIISTICSWLCHPGL